MSGLGDVRLTAREASQLRRWRLLAAVVALLVLLVVGWRSIGSWGGAVLLLLGAAWPVGFLVWIGPATVIEQRARSRQQTATRFDPYAAGYQAGLLEGRKPQV